MDMAHRSDTRTRSAAVRGLLVSASAIAVLGLASCSSTYHVAVISEPSGAMIQVDGQNAGEAPVNHAFDFGTRPSAVVSAVMPGYFPEEVVLNVNSQAVSEGELRLVLLEDQAWRVTTVSEATNSWLRVQVESVHETDDVWQKLIDSVTNRYASLEQMDRTSGYIRTIHEVRTFRGRHGNFRVRTRFICTIASREPLVYKMKIEADYTDRSGNWVPYGRVFTEDAEMLEEVQSRLGIK
jgi:hypothetical protein